MLSHRTTARGLFLLTLLASGVAAAPAAARPDGAEVGRVPRLIFPVVGEVQYRDDFGEPRGQGRHEGNDIMAARRSIAVAAEEGIVKFWTTSARAGCMLYLNGKSGTTYLYVHLNNDLKGDDNRGRCVPGVAYAPLLASGDKVEAGQPIGFVGDSGDAEGGAPHLHFEVHPFGGGAVSPYRHLQAARRLLLAVTPGKPFTAALRGSVVDAYGDGEFDGSLTLDVDQVTSWPGSIRVKGVERSVQLRVPLETLIYNPVGALIAAAQLSTLSPGQAAVAWTTRATATLPAALGEPFKLATERVLLGSN
jgi:hypothetical protein